MAKDARYYIMRPGHDPNDPWFVLAEVPDVVDATEGLYGYCDGAPLLTRDEAMKNPMFKRAIFAWEAGDDSAARLDEEKIIAWGEAQDAQFEKERRALDPKSRLRAIE